jgi:hypothetical protein
MKLIRAYSVAASGTPTQIPDLPVCALVADSFGYTSTVYLEVALDSSGQPEPAPTTLVQIERAEQGVPDDWTWLASTQDGRQHLFKVSAADAAALSA